MVNLKLRIAGITCTPPILESVTEDSAMVFRFVWNYDGVDYSSDNTTSAQVLYSINGGSTFNAAAPALSYPNTETVIDLTEVPAEIFQFKIHLLNRTCDEDSNIINYSI